MKPVRFSPLAGREVVDTAREYERRAAGLGEAFLAEMETAAGQLSAFPLSGSPFGQRLRRRLLRRFPLALLYSVRDECLWVVAVMHQGRGPTHVARRLEGHR